jgi:hypothetical protein
LAASSFLASPLLAAASFFPPLSVFSALSLSVLSPSVLSVFVLGVAFGVVPGGERRGHVLAQRHGHHLGRVRVGPAVVEVGVDRLEGAVREEVEVLAVRIEDG